MEDYSWDLAANRSVREDGTNVMLFKLDAENYELTWEAVGDGAWKRMERKEGKGSVTLQRRREMCEEIMSLVAAESAKHDEGKERERDHKLEEHRREKRESTNSSTGQVPGQDP